MRQWETIVYRIRARGPNPRVIQPRMYTEGNQCRTRASWKEEKKRSFVVGFSPGSREKAAAVAVNPFFRLDRIWTKSSFIKS